MPRDHLPRPRHHRRHRPLRLGGVDGMTLTDADREALSPWDDGRGNDSLEATVEVIVQAAVTAALNDAADAIRATGDVCEGAHGRKCIGAIAYRDAASIVRARTSGSTT